MGEVEKVTIETIKKGGVLAILYFDVHSKEKENLQHRLVQFIAEITKESGVVYARGEINEPLEFGDAFTSSAEVRILASNFGTLLSLAMLYAPMGVEILEPQELKISMADAQNIMLNISQTSQAFTNYVLKRVMDKDEKKKIFEASKRRAEIGKLLRENQGFKGAIENKQPEDIGE